MTLPVLTSCIAETITSSFFCTISRMTGLLSTSIFAASLALLSATACTSFLFLDERSPSMPFEAATAGRKVLQHLGQIAELRVVDGALDRAALGVAEHHDRPCADELGREFEAADDVDIHEISGHAGHENVADALIEHELRRHAAIDAADDRRERRLTVGGGFHLLHQVAVDALAGDEAFVAGLEQVDRVVG